MLIDALDDFVGTGEIPGTALVDWGDEALILQFFGIGDLSELPSPAMIDYRANVDMLESMDGNDAPLCFATNGPAVIDPNDFAAWDSRWDPLHVKAVKDGADALTLENVVYASGQYYQYADPSGENCGEFARRFLR